MNGAGDPPTRFCNKCGQKNHGSAGCHTGPKSIPPISLPAEGLEKLVEEIARIIGAKAMMRLDGFEPYQPMSGIYEAERRQYILAKELITLIGKAYADGELELPGEEARIKDCYVGELGGYRDIIALSGAEEE